MNSVVDDLYNPRPLNTAEVYPLEYKVLVKLDPVEETSESGIVITTGNQLEREQLAQTRGTLIALGPNAFFDWQGNKPRPGERVIIAKYAGLIVEGYDGEEYRLCNDKDLAAVLGREQKKYARDQVS